MTPVPAMKNGEIKKLPKGNSPMWCGGGSEEKANEENYL